MQNDLSRPGARIAMLVIGTGTAAADRLTINGTYQGVISGGTAPVNFSLFFSLVAATIITHPQQRSS
jgi:hypothetical protein